MIGILLCTLSMIDYDLYLAHIECNTSQLCVRGCLQFGDEDTSAVQRRQEARDQVHLKHDLVEDERRRAEEKLQRRLAKMKVQKAREQQSAGVMQTDGGQPPGIILVSLAVWM